MWQERPEILSAPLLLSYLQGKHSKPQVTTKGWFPAVPHHLHLQGSSATAVLLSQPPSTWEHNAGPAQKAWVKEQQVSSPWAGHAAGKPKGQGARSWEPTPGRLPCPKSKGPEGLLSHPTRKMWEQLGLCDDTKTLGKPGPCGAEPPAHAHSSPRRHAAGEAVPEASSCLDGRAGACTCSSSPGGRSLAPHRRGPRPQPAAGGGGSRSLEGAERWLREPDQKFHLEAARRQGLGGSLRRQREGKGGIGAERRT